MKKNLSYRVFCSALLLSSLLSEPGFGGYIGQRIDIECDIGTQQRRVAQQSATTFPLKKVGEIDNRQFRLLRRQIKKAIGRCTFTRTINAAEQVSNHYNIQVLAASFTGRDSDLPGASEYDYFNVKLIVNFFHHYRLASEARILPKEYTVKATPVIRPVNANGWEDVPERLCPVTPMSWSPQVDVSGTTHDKSSNFSVNGTVGFPSGGSIGGAYGRSWGSSRHVKDTELFPVFEDNNIKWHILFHQLSLKGGKGGFLPAFAMQQEFQWSWRIQKTVATNLNLYRRSPVDPNDDNNYFPFKLQLFAGFQGIGYTPCTNRTVHDLPVFGEEIVLLKVPEIRYGNFRRVMAAPLAGEPEENKWVNLQV